MFRRQVFVHGIEHVFVGVRSRDLEYLGMSLEDALRIGTQAAGDDHFAVVFERFADRIQRLVDGRIDEAAGVDHHKIGRVVVGRDGVAFCA